MNFKNRIYNYDGRINRILDRIQSSDLYEDNRKELLNFYRECVLQSLSKARISKYLDTLQRIVKWLDKPLQEVKKEDIIDLVHKIERNGYSEWTKHDYKVILKIFFRWFKKTDEYPEEVKWIRTTPKIKRKLPEELLSPDDIRNLVYVADNLRNKAFVLVLYESGCRIGEILTLQLKHVQFAKYGAVIIVNGKTGQRRVRLILSAPKLSQWVENHPLRDDTNAPLWVTIGTNSRNKALTYGTAKDHLKKLARKAGIKKRVYPHLFRHSRATHLASVLTEAQMKQYLGWVQASDMASTYVHLSGRDVDKTLLKINGIEVPEEKRDKNLRALTCPRCKERNSPDAKFCSKCGLPLDEKTAVRLNELSEKANKLLLTLMEQPEVLDTLLNAIDNINNLP